MRVSAIAMALQDPGLELRNMDRLKPSSVSIYIYNTGYINNFFSKDNITYAIDKETPPKEDPNNGRFI